MKNTMRPIRFIRRGQLVTVRGEPVHRTLLDYLRSPASNLPGHGTKEGCAEGDCGACTVVLGEPDGDRLRYRAINACIRLLSSIDGCVLWTVQDLVQDDGSPHPVQQAMLDQHATQCGFCSPGFVMSMFAMYQSRAAGAAALTRDQASQALSGNLCRCTGYRSILDAAMSWDRYPDRRVDEPALLNRLRAIRPDEDAQFDTSDGTSLRPASLPALLSLRRAHPGAQIVAGCTDVGLWITKQHRRFDAVIDITGVAALQQVELQADAIEIGAAVRLSDAFEGLCAQWSQLATFAARFAGLPIRNAGTLGGNVANGSPIGDSMPLLIALGAQVRLASVDGQRQIPIEQFYIGYRRNLMAADEVLTHVRVPRPHRGQWLRVYKISKRFDDDISAVCLAVSLTRDGDRITAARIGAGGVAATPARASATEAVLTGAPWNEATAQRAADSLRGEFSPISDMRASADYRRQVLGNLMLRCWHDSQGQACNLEQVDLDLFQS